MVNWILVALACCSLAAVVLTRDLATSGELEGRRRHLLSSFDEQDVTAFELAVDGGDAVTVTRGEGDARFELKSPLHAEAEEATVDQLLRTLRFATWLRSIPQDGIQRSTLGLDPPKARLALSLDDRQVELLLGGSAQAPDGALYLEVRGNEAESGVFVISETIANDLWPDPTRFRIQRLIPYSQTDIARLSIASKTQRIVLERASEGTFHFAEHYDGARLDPLAVDRLFLQFARTQSADFLPVDEARRQLHADEERITLEITPRDKHKEAAKVLLGGRCPDAPSRSIALREAPAPIAACVHRDVESAFVEQPELLLDLSLFRFRQDEVEEVRIERGEEVLEFARKGDGFVMRSPKRGDVDRQAGLLRLDGMLDTRGRWLSKADPLVDDFRAVTRVKLTRGAAREEDVAHDLLELGEPLNIADAQPQRQGVVVRRQDDGAFLFISVEAADAFRIDSAMLRNRVILDVPLEQLKSVDIKWQGGHQRLKQTGRATYELAEPSGFGVDSGLAQDIFDAVRTLRATNWVSNDIEAKFGFEEPRLEATLRTADKTRTLLIGARAPRGGYFATLDRDGAFVINPALLRTLSTWAIDRSLFMLDSERLERLILEGAGRSLSLERFGASFLQREGENALSPGQIVELLDAFSLLRSESVVHLGEPTTEQGANEPVLRVTAWLKSDVLDEPRRHVFVIGVADTFNDAGIHYAWRDGIPAVFALPRQSVRRILESW